MAEMDLSSLHCCSHALTYLAWGGGITFYACNLDFDLMTFIYKLDLTLMKMCPRAKNKRAE